MLIESKIKRAGGSHVDLDGVAYHFKDDGTGRHVAEVLSRRHLAVFLAIPEGYQIPEEPEEDDAGEQPQGDNGADSPPPPPTDDGGLDEPEGEAQGGGDAATEDADGDGEENLDAPATEDMGRDALSALWEAKFGRKPHAAKSLKKLAEEING